MSTQHTPGPWMVRHDFLCSDKTLTVGVAAVNIGSESGAVAWPTGTNEAQELANARLIAAAPDLLDALKEARRCLAWACEQRPEFQAERNAVDAAIAKATGAARPFL